VKLFISEAGSDKMVKFASAEDDRNKVVSALAQIEARSAICRLRQGKALTADEARNLFTTMERTAHDIMAHAGHA